MDFEKVLKENTAYIEENLKRYMVHDDCAQSVIYESMSYSLFAGGKRLRPNIMLLVNEMCGGSREEVIPFACAIEMIHTYSLIHDDLPAMDNDDLRRGKPTNHIAYGEDIAILAGDALLNKAMQTALSADVSADKALAAARILFDSSGSEGMIGGQVIDIKNSEFTVGKLENLHLLKTGAIIRSSGVVGGVIAGANKAELEAIDEYCKNLGIAFQIQDDILDVLGNAEDLGKPIGSDAENNKTTYVTLFGTEKAGQLAEDYTNKAIESVQCVFGEKSEKLVALAEYLTKRRI